MTTWDKIGHLAFVEIFNGFVDQKETSEITTLVDKTISSHSGKMGFVCSTNWELDLPVEAIIEITETIAQRTLINDNKNISSFVHVLLTHKLNGALDRAGKRSTYKLRDILLNFNL